MNILKEIKKNAKKESKKKRLWVKKYMGTDKIFYSLSADAKKKIAKEWIKENNNISLPEYKELLDNLFAGKSHEEICIGAKILELTPKFKKQLEPEILNKWLDNAVGWGEVDSICQSNFSAEEILSKWSKWKKLILELSQDKNINKRRASLVLLVSSARTVEEERVTKLSFKLIDELKKENDILITKAISWLLRSLAVKSPKKVKDYLEKNKESLPKIAVRETNRKILTGKK